MSRIAATFRRLLREQGGWGSVWVPLAVTIALGGATVYVVTQQQPVSGVTANVWLATNGSDSTCTRSASVISSSDANYKPCQTWNKACQVATGGDTVAVQNGSYPLPFAARYLESDCADGAGADNPNTRTNWTKFICGDNSSRDSVTQPAGDFSVNGNVHAEINGSCFYFGQLRTGEGGDNVRTSQNLAVIGVHMDAFIAKGARNILLQDSEIGPALACYTAGGGAPVNQQCKTTDGIAMETKWASTGFRESLGQFQIGQNSGGLDTQNIQFRNVWAHDQQTRDQANLHPGCGIILNQDDSANPTDNIFIDNLKCERDAVLGIDTSPTMVGLTIQNSQFNCAVEPWDNMGYDPARWAQDACQQRAIDILDGGSIKNVLLRYNTFRGSIHLGNASSTFTNVRVIGNVADHPENCPAAVTFDYNAWYTNSTCGTNFKNSGSSPAPSTSDLADPDDGSTYQTTTSMDFHLTGGAKAYENWIPDGGADYQTTDMDGTTRTFPTDAGADQR